MKTVVFAFFAILLQFLVISVLAGGDITCPAYSDDFTVKRGDDIFLKLSDEGLEARCPSSDYTGSSLINFCKLFKILAKIIHFFKGILKLIKEAFLELIEKIKKLAFLLLKLLFLLKKALLVASCPCKSLFFNDAVCAQGEYWDGYTCVECSKKNCGPYDVFTFCDCGGDSSGCSSCKDYELNGQETCIDGGGPVCREQGKLCAEGEYCFITADCAQEYSTICYGANIGYKNPGTCIRSYIDAQM